MSYQPPDPHPGAAPGRDALYGASFPQAVARLYARYVDFTGRSSRSEYLWVVLFNSLVFVAIAVLIGVTDGSAGGSQEPGPGTTLLSLVLVLFVLGTLVPAIALQCRRMRDAGLSPLLVLLNLVPYLGSLVTFILCCLPTKQAVAHPYPGQQGYGQSPYGQQGYDPSPYGQPQFGQPQYDQSQYGQSQYDQSQYDQSQYDQSQYDQSQYDQSQFGQSQFGQSQFGQSQFGQSQFGQSQFGQSQYGQPQYEQQGQNQPPYGQAPEGPPAQASDPYRQPGGGQDDDLPPQPTWQQPPSEGPGRPS